MRLSIIKKKTETYYYILDSYRDKKDKSKVITKRVETIGTYSQLKKEHDNPESYARSVVEQRNAERKKDKMHYEEDIDFTSIINKPAFVAFISRTEVDFDFNDTDMNKRMSKKPFEGHKRAPKEKAPDISTKVLDRAQVKLAALKAVQQSQQQNKARA